MLNKFRKKVLIAIAALVLFISFIMLMAILSIESMSSFFFNLGDVLSNSAGTPLAEITESEIYEWANGLSDEELKLSMSQSYIPFNPKKIVYYIDNLNDKAMNPENIIVNQYESKDDIKDYKAVPFTKVIDTIEVDKDGEVDEDRRCEQVNLNMYDTIKKYSIDWKTLLAIDLDANTSIDLDDTKTTDQAIEYLKSFYDFNYDKEDIGRVSKHTKDTYTEEKYYEIEFNAGSDEPVDKEFMGSKKVIEREPKLTLSQASDIFTKYEFTYHEDVKTYDSGFSDYVLVSEEKFTKKKTKWVKNEKGEREKKTKKIPYVRKKYKKVRNYTIEDLPHKTIEKDLPLYEKGMPDEPFRFNRFSYLSNAKNREYQDYLSNVNNYLYVMSSEYSVNFQSQLNDSHKNSLFQWSLGGFDKNNDYIYNTLEEYNKGIGNSDLPKIEGEWTRNDLVETAQSLMAPNRVPYFWGGKHWQKGKHPEWGVKSKKVTSKGSDTTGTYRPWGLDCSGFVGWTYTQMLDRSKASKIISDGTVNQWDKTYAVSGYDIRPGDLGFYQNGGGRHVGIYIGKDDKGRHIFIHCQGGKANGVVMTYNIDKYSTATSKDYMKEPSIVNKPRYLAPSKFKYFRRAYVEFEDDDLYVNAK